MAFPAATSGRARRFHFLLRVTYGGTDYRFATDALNVPSASGTVAHAAGLSVGNYSETFQFLSQNIDRQSVSVSVLWRGIAAQIAEGYRLDTARGELAVWVEGTNYEDRRVLVVGQCMEPSYGADSDPVAFSIEAPPWLDRGTWPDLLQSPTTIGSQYVSQVGGLQTIPTDSISLDYVSGKTAPLVVGNPGNMNQTKRTLPATAFLRDATDIYQRTKPGAFCDMFVGHRLENNGITALGNPSRLFYELLILCGHPTQAGAFGGDGTQKIRGSSGLEDAPLAILFNDANQYLTALVPFHTTIGGRTVTAVNMYDFLNTLYEYRYTVNDNDAVTNPITSFTNSDNFTTAPLYRDVGEKIGFTFASAYTGHDTFYGLTTGQQGGPLKTAHELIALVLGASAYPVDWPRFYAALDRVPTFDVAGYVDERVAVWDFVSRELLPLLPVSLRNGPNGLYMMVADFTATVDQAIGTLYAGRDCFRESGIQYERRLADLSGIVEVEVGRMVDDRPRSTIRVDGSSMLQSTRAELAQDSARLDRLTSRVAQTDRADELNVETIRAAWLDSGSGAHYVAHQKLAARAAQLRTITYRLAPEYVELEAGDLVRIVDAEVSIDGPAYLSTLTIGDGVVLGTFTIYDPIMR